MQKAKMSTLKGTLTETFTPFHTELINASSAEEVCVEGLNMRSHKQLAVGSHIALLVGEPPAVS